MASGWQRPNACRSEKRLTGPGRVARERDSSAADLERVVHRAARRVRGGGR
jgi:hypothetical protein